MQVRRGVLQNAPGLALVVGGLEAGELAQLAPPAGVGAEGAAASMSHTCLLYTSPSPRD